MELQVDDTRVAGEIRASLAAWGTLIGPHDTVIAAQTLVRDLVLITHDTRQFTRVRGLKVEDQEI